MSEIACHMTRSVRAHAQVLPMCWTSECSPEGGPHKVKISYSVVNSKEVQSKERKAEDL